MTKCLKRRLLSGERVSDEQYLELPRAIADPDGIPQKGDSVWRSRHTVHFPSKLVSRHRNFRGNVSHHPLRIHKTMKEYAAFLLQKYTLKYLSIGVREIHITLVVFTATPKISKGTEEMLMVNDSTTIALSKMTQRSHPSGGIFLIAESAKRS